MTEQGISQRLPGIEPNTPKPGETAVPMLRPIHFFAMSHDMEHDHLSVDIVSDSIVTHAKPPPPNLHVHEPAATVRIGLDTFQCLEYLTLHLLGKPAKVTFKTLRWKKLKPSHLLGAGIDRLEGVQTRDLPTLVLPCRLPECFLEFLVLTFRDDLEQIFEIVDAQQDHLGLPLLRNDEPLTLSDTLDDLSQVSSRCESIDGLGHVAASYGHV